MAAFFVSLMGLLVAFFQESVVSFVGKELPGWYQLVIWGYPGLLFLLGIGVACRSKGALWAVVLLYAVDLAIWLAVAGLGAIAAVVSGRWIAVSLLLLVLALRIALLKAMMDGLSGIDRLERLKLEVLFPGRPRIR